VSIDHSDPKLDATDGEAGLPPAAALALLAAERDAVLRGLVHALSNRIGIVGAVAGMLEPDAPAAGVAVGMLRAESDRLSELLDEFRLFAGEPVSAPEPVHLPDLVASVLALHAHHPTLRDVPCAAHALQELPPAMADPDAVRGALLAAVGAAKRAAGDGGARVRGVVERHTVRLIAEPVDPRAEADAGAEEWPLPRGAGRVRLSSGGGSVALPTLASARQGV
jgi:nitrogen-specific signal transduction histidine kinase